jgi:hypothetical protein
LLCKLLNLIKLRLFNIPETLSFRYKFFSLFLEINELAIEMFYFILIIDIQLIELQCCSLLLTFLIESIISLVKSFQLFIFTLMSIDILLLGISVFIFLRCKLNFQLIDFMVMIARHFNHFLPMLQLIVVLIDVSFLFSNLVFEVINLLL